MTFHLWQRGEPTESSIGGVRQPTAQAPEFPVEDIELFLTPLNGGGNNRSYKITCSEKVLMGKVYFKNPSDHRNRLLHETSFAKYLEFLGLENFPKLIAADDNMGVAAFDWLSGKIFESDSVIDKDYWEQCFDFLCDIQNPQYFL